MKNDDNHMLYLIVGEKIAWHLGRLKDDTTEILIHFL